jgi:hypothetical protein
MRVAAYSSYHVRASVSLWPAPWMIARRRRQWRRYEYFFRCGESIKIKHVLCNYQLCNCTVALSQLLSPATVWPTGRPEMGAMTTSLQLHIFFWTPLRAEPEIYVEPCNIHDSWLLMISHIGFFFDNVSHIGFRIQRDVEAEARSRRVDPCSNFHQSVTPSFPPCSVLIIEATRPIKRSGAD